MFDAAKAALMASGEIAASPKSHGGLISLFSLRFVKTAKIPRDIGKLINDVHEIRLLADYSAENIPLDKAALAIEGANRFIDAVVSLPEMATFV